MKIRLQVLVDPGLDARIRKAAQQMNVAAPVMPLCALQAHSMIACQR